MYWHKVERACPSRTQRAGTRSRDDDDPQCGFNSRSRLQFATPASTRVGSDPKPTATMSHFQSLPQRTTRPLAKSPHLRKIPPTHLCAPRPLLQTANPKEARSANPAAPKTRLDGRIHCRGLATHHNSNASVLKNPLSVGVWNQTSKKKMPFKMMMTTRTIAPKIWVFSNPDSWSCLWASID